MTSTLNKTPNLPEILSGTVLVTGAGISGVGIARLLADLNVDVLIADANETARDRAMEVADVAGIHPDQALAELSRFSCVVTSPGWRPDTPLLRAAQAAGLEVLGDVELCYRLDRASVFGPPRTWMVVTGTNGKTTTTSMLASIMQHAGYQAEAVGNIGVSVAEAISAPQRIDVLVAELSSFQLHWSSQLVPDVGVLLNLAEDHIDWHGSMAAYAAAKAKVLVALLAIAGLDDALVQQYVTTPVMGFTMHPPQVGQVGVTDGMIVDNLHGTPRNIVPVAGLEPPGPAGIYDALAATAAAVALVPDLQPSVIAQALQSFKVAGHRGQQVAEARGIVAIDNSKATNPHAADSALAGHDSVIWVAGGQLKGAEVDDLIARHAHRLKAVALMGVDRNIIRESVEKHAPGVPIFVTDDTDPQSAMDAVCAWAVTQASSGDAIVLAPAAASLDMYTGMGQRGVLFAESVSAHLGGVAPK
ncbi:UDP-N-acetylmuramoyl-L-alanine--D-glutamate ligase [Corynebacterium matruchotii]|uniref:UDP-N-acetylmuramoyl-L-alanine--D-glutamate ligase n=1 Tax=Corynebacterium matruchotii TaxID=43768 RepID=UPI0028E71F47|nr:UDP-N-acetylmuramoyl-L-alanine--D-glutamate ligase [Corynebacterium matruchotii]